MSSQGIVVIGAGVIGVCSAYYLASAGHSVILLEKGAVCSGCSYGNVGLLCPSHAVPMAAPGVVRKALRWMWDDRSPFFIRPRLDLELLKWLRKFSAASTEHQVLRNLPLLRDLMEASLQLYRQLRSIPGVDFGFRDAGLLTLFKTHSAFEDAQREAELLATHGIKSKILNATETREIEPMVLPRITGSVYFPDDAHLSPADFVRSLAAEVQRLGVRIHTSTEVVALEFSGPRVSVVRTTRGDFWPDAVVLAGGAWSAALARGLAVRLPIQAGKGYSVTIRPQHRLPRTPLSFKEARVVATPMGETLRLGGTLELTGLDLTINLRRVNAIRQAPSDYVSGVQDGEVIEIWSGLRPCTPDGLPIIERHDRLGNLIIATGHAMLGMSLGPITGALVSQIVSGQPPTCDLAALRASRFN